MLKNEPVFHPMFLKNVTDVAVHGPTGGGVSGCYTLLISEAH